MKTRLALLVLIAAAVAAAIVYVVARQPPRSGASGTRVDAPAPATSTPRKSEDF